MRSDQPTLEDQVTQQLDTVFGNEESAVDQVLGVVPRNVPGGYVIEHRHQLVAAGFALDGDLHLGGGDWWYGCEG